MVNLEAVKGNARAILASMAKMDTKGDLQLELLKQAAIGLAACVLDLALALSGEQIQPDNGLADNSQP